MTPNLEAAHGESTPENGFRRASQLGEVEEGAHEEQTIGSDKTKLNEG